MNTRITPLPIPNNLADSFLSRLWHDPIGQLSRLPTDTANTVNNEATGLLNKGGDELMNTIGSVFGLLGALTGQQQQPGSNQAVQQPTVNYAPYIIGGTVLLAGGLILLSNRNEPKRRKR